VGRILVTFQNEQGALATMSTVIAKNGGNIVNLKITSRSVDFWDVTVDVYVSDNKHLNNIVAALRATPLMTNVDRAKGR
jgi:GTP pyrophosphokinase